MVEKLKQVKALIDENKPEEAKALIDEIIAATPQPTGDEQENVEVPLPGEGTNGIPK